MKKAKSIGFAEHDSVMAGSARRLPGRHSTVERPGWNLALPAFRNSEFRIVNRIRFANSYYGYLSSCGGFQSGFRRFGVDGQTAGFTLTGFDGV